MLGQIKTATHLQEELKYFVLDMFKMCDKFRLANCFTNVLGFFLTAVSVIHILHGEVFFSMVAKKSDRLSYANVLVSVSC